MNGKLGKIITSANVLSTLYTVPVTAEFATLNINIVNSTNSTAKIKVGVSLLNAPASEDYIEYDVELQPNKVLERTGFVCSTGEKITVLSDISGVIARVHGFEETLTGVAGPTSIPVDGTGATGTWNISVAGTAAGLSSNLPVSKLNGGVNAGPNTFWRGDGTWSTITLTGVLTGVSATEPITSSGGSAPKIGITAATTTAAGSMSAADKAKLDGIAAGAQVNTVASVAGKTGVVTLVKDDVGLGNVDNTSDANKPVSTAQSTALALKANLASPTLTGTPSAPTAALGTNTTQIATTAFVNAKFASDAAPLDHIGSTGGAHGVVTPTAAGFMSTTDKIKLDGIAAGATANTGTVTGVTGTAPIASSGGAAPVISISAATTSAAGSMSAADKTKLDGIATGANAYTHPNGDGNLHVPATGTTNNGKVLTAGPTAGSLSWTEVSGMGTVTGVSGTSPIISTGGNTPQIGIKPASISEPGSMSAADKAKLDGIADGATANTGTVTGVTGTAPIVSSGGAAPAISISAATTSAAGSMSAADKTKLDGIAAGAQVNTVTSVATRTGAVVLVKADVGLGNVDNTSDANKPVSTAQSTALGLKANLDSPSLTGTPLAPTAAVGTNTTQIATTAFVNAEIANDVVPTLVGKDIACASVTATGDITAFSDEQLKREWEDLPENFVEQLAGVKSGTFNRIDINKRQVGVSAQSLKLILPEAVTQGEYLSVAYGNAAMASVVELAKTNMRLLAMVEKLETRVKELENK